ncbi:MAG TPA: hypothetical protein VD736_06045 [Nitrososphaera sp.]|nr:hypothetical protein [Nitrososphaera sp.]
MDDRSALRVMTAIAAAILVSMFAISILARMNMLQGVGVQNLNETTTAEVNEEIGRRFLNFTSLFR